MSTPGQAGAGSIPDPDVMTAEQERGFLTGNAARNLAELRRQFGGEYRFGHSGLDYVTWRLDGSGDPVRAKDAADLREFLTARPS